MYPEGIGYDDLDFLQLPQDGIYRWDLQDGIYRWDLQHGIYRWDLQDGIYRWDLRNTTVETLCFYILVQFAWGVGGIP
jgi:hypothetical protein